jgi:hypothetical protein
MAAPLVAGCTALIREFMIKNQGMAQPSDALVKCLFTSILETISARQQ